MKKKSEPLTYHKAKRQLKKVLKLIKEYGLIEEWEQLQQRKPTKANKKPNEQT